MVMSLYVAGLWRYPVKTLAGEPLPNTTVGVDGIEGDRSVWVLGPEGVRTWRRPSWAAGAARFEKGRRAPAHQQSPWESAEAIALVKRAAGDDTWLEAADEQQRFDVLPLLVATDGAVAAFGRDVRRLRPNILIGGVDGLAERDWPGADLHIGRLVVRLDSLRARCPMTTVHPDTLERDPEVLRDIGRRFGGRLALNVDVARPGRIAVGDSVTLIPAR